MSKIKQEVIQEDTVIAEAKDFISKPIPCLEITPRATVALKIPTAPVRETSEIPLTATSTSIPSSKTAVSGPTEAPEENKNDKQIASPTTPLFEVLSRLAKLELRISKLERNNGNGHRADSIESKTDTEQLHDISKQVEIIVAGLLNTPDYDIGRTFHCRSCGSNGTVAIKVRCTTCKQENWWGWWPQNNKTI